MFFKSLYQTGYVRLKFSFNLTKMNIFQTSEDVCICGHGASICLQALLVHIFTYIYLCTYNLLSMQSKCSQSKLNRHISHVPFTHIRNAYYFCFLENVSDKKLRRNFKRRKQFTINRQLLTKSNVTPRLYTCIISTRNRWFEVHLTYGC